MPQIRRVIEDAHDRMRGFPEVGPRDPSVNPFANAAPFGEWGNAANDELSNRLNEFLRHQGYNEDLNRIAAAHHTPESHARGLIEFMRQNYPYRESTHYFWNRRPGA